MSSLNTAISQMPLRDGGRDFVFFVLAISGRTIRPSAATSSGVRAKLSIKSKHSFSSSEISETPSLITHHHVLLLCNEKFRNPQFRISKFSGAPGAIPTRDLPLRRRTLYATELREHKTGKS